MSLSDEEESIAESLSEELTVSSHPYERSEDAKGAVTSNSGLDDAYSEDFAKTSASTVASVSHAASVEEHVDDEDDEDEDFEDDFEDDVEDNVYENDVEDEASKRTRADSPVSTGTQARRSAEPQDVSVAYTTEFEEDPSMASAAFPEARSGKSANADVLRADLILAQRELARLRGRDIQMLVNKQARASKRREEHEAALERAVGDAERCRQQAEIFRTRAAEAQNGQLCAENESTIQRTTIARLEAEAKILRANLEAANARAESLAQDRLRAECDMQERLKRATLVHEAELEAARQALASYRQEVEESRDKFETTALERARAHESRVDRMQAALEAEMAILQRERDSLGRAQREVHSKLDAQLQEERRALHEARVVFERDRDAGLREVVAGRTDLEARRRALQDRELVMQGDQDRVAKERHELALLRSCVETERDKLIAARQDAELARENAQQKVQDLDLRSRQLVAERETMRTAQTEIERERDALQSEQHKLEDEKSKLQRERAKIEAMAKTLATSLQASLFAETPAEARNTIGLELGTDDDFFLLPSTSSKLRERQPRHKRADKSRTWSDRDKEAKEMEEEYKEEETHRLTLQDNNNTLLLRGARRSLNSAPPPAPQPQDDASKLWGSEIVSELLAFSPQW